jgi:putrescine aminotransferase
VGQLLGGMVEVASSGAWIHVADGRRYLDFGGYGVFILGHRHPVVTAAVHRQLDLHPLASRTFLEPVTAQAAAALARVGGPSNSPRALRQLRCRGHRGGAQAGPHPRRTSIITTRSGYHGKTLGALSVTANPTYQDPFRPLLPDVTQVVFGDIAAMSWALRTSHQKCVVILEPVQGEGGVVVPPPGYLREVADLCTENDALLIVDEIQTGMGRLGTWWGIEAERVVPDILLVGKAVGRGGAHRGHGGHTTCVRTFARTPTCTSTFAGSPLACAAAGHDRRHPRRADRRPRGPHRGAALREMRIVCAGLRPAGLVEVRGQGCCSASSSSTLEQWVSSRFSCSAGVLSCHSLAPRACSASPPAVLDDQEISQFLTAFSAQSPPCRRKVNHAHRHHPPAAPGTDPAAAYERISDFARYPSMVDTVREVVVAEPDSDGSIRSQWTVRFRSGLLQWTERDVLDAAERTITFTQLEGDFHTFTGQWRIDQIDGGTVVVFEATFDLGMASLEAILDPIADAALRSNIRLIVEGLLGDVTEIVPEPTLDRS